MASFHAGVNVLKSPYQAEKLRRGWRKGLLVIFLLVQIGFTVSYIAPLIKRRTYPVESMTEMNTVSPKPSVPQPPAPTPLVKKGPAQKASAQKTPVSRQQVETSHKRVSESTDAPTQSRLGVSILPWTRPLGPLGPAAVERMNLMRKTIDSHDLGRLQFFDPELPNDIEATMIHCTRKDFDSKNRLLVVSSIDASVMHHMPTYVTMISKRSNENAEILLLATDIRMEQIEMLCSFARGQHLSTPVHVLLLSGSTLGAFFKYENNQHGILTHVPIITMARLLLPSLMGGAVETVLYLDLDIVMTDSLRLSKDMIGDMCPGYNSSSIGICARESLNHNIKEWCDNKTTNALGLQQVARGFNAGVLVLNLTSMKDFGFSRFAAIISRTFGLNDQVINVAYTKNSYIRMKREYNIFDGQDPKNVASKMIHFAGSRNKPWAHWSKGYNIWHSFEPPAFHLIWSDFKIIPNDTINSMIRFSQGMPISVYCSTRACFDQVSTTGYPLVVQDMKSLRRRMKDNTPLQRFFSRLQLYKVLLEGSFPDFLNKALRLNVLYLWGGLVLPSQSRMVKSIPEDRIFGKDQYWFAESEDEQDFLLFARNVKNKQVWKLMEKLMDTLERECLETAGDTACMNVASKSIFQKKDSSFRFSDYFEVNDCQPHKKHYSILWYGARVRSMNQPGQSRLAANLGDEIQSLASISWLPYVDARVERDNLTEPSLDTFPERSIKTFMNGWYGTKDMPWPPSKSIDPIFLAFHIEPSVFQIFSSRKSMKYLMSNQTMVGARDTSTAEFLRSKGVSTFFSGCMTLTTYPIGQRNTSNAECKYLIVDIAESAYDKLPKELKQNTSCRISHRLEGDAETVLNSKARFIKAFKLFEMYSSAKVVITSRLHSALPASSMGATVIMIQSDHLPGGGSGKDNNRFSGLDAIFFNVEEKSLSSELSNFIWENPWPNPGAALIQKFRCNLLRFMKRYHDDLIDAIHLFDVHGVFDPCS